MATRWAWDVDADGTDKFVLVALADHADDDGVCWPSVERLAQRCGVSPRSVQRAIGELMKRGLVSRLGANGTLPRYRLAIHAAAVAAAATQATVAAGENDPRQVVTPDNLSPVTERHPSQIVTGPLTDCHRTPDNLSPEPTSKPTIEPLLPSVAARAVRPGKGCRLPSDWQPDEACRAYALERNLDPDRLAEDFRGYWHSPDAKDPMKRDWNGTWQRRCRDVVGKPAYALRNVHLLRPGQPAESAAEKRMRERDERMRARAAGREVGPQPRFFDQRRIM